MLQSLTVFVSLSIILCNFIHFWFIYFEDLSGVYNFWPGVSFWWIFTFILCIREWVWAPRGWAKITLWPWGGSSRTRAVFWHYSIGLQVGKGPAPPRALRHQAPIKKGRRASILGGKGIRDRGFLSRGLMYYVTQQHVRSVWVREFQSKAAA